MDSPQPTESAQQSCPLDVIAVERLAEIRSGIADTIPASAVFAKLGSDPIR